MNRRYVLSATLSLFTLSHLVSSQRPDYTLAPFQVNRAFFWSSKAPITKAINDLAPEAIPSINLLLHHAARVENAIIKSLTKRRAPKPDDPVKPCNPQISELWRTSLGRNFGIKGFLQPSFACGTEVNGVFLESGDPPGYTLDDLYDAVFNHKWFIRNRVKEITARVINNFTEPDLSFNFSYATTSVVCSQTPACLVRQHEHWYTGVGIQSNGKDTHVMDGKEVSIIEYPRVVDGKLGDNLHLWLPVYDNGTMERVIRNDATTMIQRWARAPNPSCFRPIEIDMNPAVLDAVDQADLSAQQAEDAITSSNLAILVLPLGLNLIPIALVAEVNNLSMFVYTLLSDVLTVLPLAIKGMELMIIGNNRWRSVVTRMGSEELGNGTKPISAGGEIWAAECKVRDGVYKTGAILISVSMVFLIVGIGSEVLARWYVTRLMMKREWRRQSMFSMTEEEYSEAESGRFGIQSSDGTSSVLGFVGAGNNRFVQYSLVGKKRDLGQDECHS